MVLRVWYSWTSYVVQVPSPVSGYVAVPVGTVVSVVQPGTPLARCWTVVVAFASPFVQPRAADEGVTDPTVSALGAAVGPWIDRLAAPYRNGHPMLYGSVAIRSACACAVPTADPAWTDVPGPLAASIVHEPGGVTFWPDQANTSPTPGATSSSGLSWVFTLIDCTAIPP